MGAAGVAIFGRVGLSAVDTYFAALKLGPAGPVAVLDRLSLPLVFLFGVGLLGEKPGWPGWAGLLVAATGILMIAWDATRRVAA